MLLARRIIITNTSPARFVRPYREMTRGMAFLRSASREEEVTAETTGSPVDFSSYQATNEPLLEFLKGSDERKRVESALKRMSSQIVDVPIVVGDQEIRTKEFRFQVQPFDHKQKVAKFYNASPDIVQNAIDVGMAARTRWELTPFEERAQIFLRAADLMAGKYRAELIAATILGQGKTVFQAEIDAAAELVDFLRFNVQFAADVTRYQPISTKMAKNSMVYRGLEGFVAAISPFNFTAIGGNLATAPAMMGNVVLWKPSHTAVLSNYIIFRILHEAGLPPGVINFLPSEGKVFGASIVRSPHLAAVNFTGSVPTFQWLWKKVAENLGQYKNFPRIAGEVGGKNYHLVHSSANIPHAVFNTIRSAFEYSGQKCSACSRLYVADDIWPEFKKQLLKAQSELTLGSPFDMSTFMSAVIDEPSFERIKGFIDHARNSKDFKILAGGKTDKTKGFFIEPTIIDVATHATDKIMKDEIFGPVLSVYIYPAGDLDKVVSLVGETTPFALTGAIFAEDKDILRDWSEKLRYTAGNFYINDKSTGAVVGQQPFGGARHSGTNDKAGSPHYLLRWTSPQTIKEGLTPLNDWRYPHLVQ